MIKLVQLLLKAYHLLISPWLGSRCRFTPSCSEYANQALETHGLAKGLLLTIRRLAKCHPWGQSGFDPVPPLLEPNKQESKKDLE